MFIDDLKEIYKKQDIRLTRDFLESSLENSLKDNNISLAIEVINELIGFLRDISEFDDSVKYSKALINLINKINIDDNAKFICYINIANSFRAASLKKESINYFDKAISLFNEANLNDYENLAALYNNYALLYEEIDLLKAKELLNKALEIKLDEIKLATTYVNLSFVAIKLNDLDECLNYLNKAKVTFEKYPYDFHASGYYNAWGKYYFLTKDFEKSINYYYKSLNNLKRTVGKNLQYQETLDELNEVYKVSNIKFEGLIKRSNEYYNEYKDILFMGIESYDKIAVGLFGMGSECYYLDDALSMDHDYEIGFIVLCDDDINVNIYNKLKENYNNLPNVYENEIINKLDKHGVFYFSDYLNKYLKSDSSLILNGKIFFHQKSSFYDLRNSLIEKYKTNKIIHIASKTLEINQIIGYNLNRLKKRNDINSIKLLKNHLIDRLIEYAYMMDNLPIPHEKIQLKLIKNKDLIKYINDSLSDNLDIKSLNNYLINNLLKLNIIKSAYSSYIEDYRNEIVKYIDDFRKKTPIIDNIIELEWNMFQELKNIGGRASCQDNYPYFRLMRKSQYYAWDMELIESYLNDLSEAKKYGYNVLAIKYGFMEESLDIEHFNKIKDNLPKLEEKRINLNEAIIKLQLEMFEEFQKENKEDSSLMRTLYSNTDSVNNASYETYLRGELSSYSEKTVYLYGKMLTNYSINKANYVKTVINYTYIFK